MKNFFSVFFLLLCPFILQAQFPTLDPDFNPLDLPDFQPVDLSVQKDKKILLLGTDAEGLHLLNTHSDGTLNHNFGNEGSVLLPFQNSPLDVRFRIFLQPDDKIIIAGSVRDESIFEDIRYVIGLIRYHQDGTVDNDFGTAGIVYLNNSTPSFLFGDDMGSNFFGDLIFQGNKILIGGSSTIPFPVEDDHRQAISAITLFRLHMDGNPDGTFEDNGIKTIIKETVYDDSFIDFENISLNKMEFQTDGKILILASTRHEVAEGFHLAIIRVHPDGTVDESFNNGEFSVFGSGHYEGGRDLVVLDNDYFYVSADHHQEHSIHPDYLQIIKFQKDGAIDESFGQQGILDQLPLGPGQLLINDKILLSINNALLIFNQDGTNEAFYPVQNLTRFKLQESNKLLTISYNRPQNSGNLQRHLLQGDPDIEIPATYPRPDPDFNEVSYSVFNADMTVQHDGKILVFEPGRLYRLEKNGGIDNTFGVNGEVVFSEPSYLTERFVRIYIQEDGKIILANSTGSRLFAFETYIQLLRLNQDGTIDNDFGENGFVNYEIPFDYTGMTDFEDLPIMPFQFAELKFQSDGKIVVAGNSTIPTGQPTPPDIITTPWDTFSLFRFKADGSIDESFGEGGNFLVPIHLDPGTQITGYLSDMAIQDDDKIILGGTGYYWVPEPGFPTFFPIVRHAIVRLEPNGAIDPSFNSGRTLLQALGTDGGTGWIGNIALQDDGKIIVTSKFDPYSYLDQRNTQILRLNPNGSLDPSFAENGILDLPLLSDFSWYYSEDFMGILPNGDIFIYQNFVASHLIKSDGTLDTSFGVDGNFYLPTNTLRHSLALQNANLIVADWESKRIRRYILSPSDQKFHEVVRFTLINALTNEELYELEDGAVINLQEIGTKEINIRAYTNPEPTGSVKFNLTGAETYNHIENFSYYALYANQGDNFFSWKPALGNYQLTATPFTEARAQGSAGNHLTISFSIIDEAVSAPLAVEKFTLINAKTNEELFELEDGQTINLREIGTKEINIRAYTNPEPTGSVRFNLTGAQTYNHIENFSYYALYANQGDNFFSWKPALGNYQLTATPFTEARAQGSAGNHLTISFSIIDEAVSPPLAVEKFTLINAKTNEELFELEDGQTINLQEIGTREINIRAYTNPEPTGSVRFNLTGAQTYNHIENFSYYALYANKGDNFFSWKPALGQYNLIATPYSEARGMGEQGSSLSVSFVIIDGINDASFRIANIYPNPASNTLFIPVDSEQQNIKIMMFDSRGKQVVQNLFMNHEKNQIEIDVSGLESNAYIIQIISDKEVKNLRWLKE